MNQRNAPLPSFIVTWVILAAALVPAAAPAQLDDEAVWTQASGEAVMRGNRNRALAQAQQTALRRALADVLTEWIAPQDIERRIDLFRRAFFRQPQQFALSLSNATTRIRGARLHWQAKVRFDRARINKTLRDIGALSRWDKQPTFVLAGTTPTQAVRQALDPRLRVLGTHGIQVRYAGEATGIEADATLTLTIERETQPHPTMPGEQWAVTRTTLSGTLAGEPLSLSWVLHPPQLILPAPIRTATAIQQLLQPWGRAYLAAYRDALWTISGLVFDTPRAWLRFDRRLRNRRDLFHDVHATRIERNGDRWWVDYAFFLDDPHAPNAEAWLLNQGWDVQREGAQAFTVSPTAP